MRKILILLIFVLALCNTMVQAALIGGKDTTTIELYTLSSDNTPYIVLESCYIGDYRNVCSVFNVTIDNKKSAVLGNSKEGSTTLKIKLKPDKRHTIKVSYDKDATKAWWRRANGNKSMPHGDNVVNWNIKKTYGVEKYKRTTSKISDQPWVYTNDSQTKDGSKKSKKNKKRGSSGKTSSSPNNDNPNPFDSPFQIDLSGGKG